MAEDQTTQVEIRPTNLKHRQPKYVCRVVLWLAISQTSTKGSKNKQDQCV